MFTILTHYSLKRKVIKESLNTMKKCNRFDCIAKNARILQLSSKPCLYQKYQNKLNLKKSMSKRRMICEILSEKDSSYCCLSDSKSL